MDDADSPLEDGREPVYERFRGASKALSNQPGGYAESFMGSRPAHVQVFDPGELISNLLK